MYEFTRSTHANARVAQQSPRDVPSRMHARWKRYVHLIHQGEQVSLQWQVIQP